MKYLPIILLTGLWLAATFIDSKSVYSDLSAFQWSNCGGSLPVEVANLSITPDPIVLPGIATLYLDIVSSISITSPTQMDVVIEKQVGDSWLEIPCIDSHYGTCTSSDFCQTLQNIFGLPDQPCPYGIQCRCPFEAGDYTIDVVIPLNVNPPGEVTDGNYHLYMGMNNSVIGQLFCVDVYATLLVQEN